MGHYDSCYEAEERQKENENNPNYMASQVFAKQAKIIKEEMDALLSTYQKDRRKLTEKLEKVEWAQQEICPHLHKHDNGYCPDCYANT